MPLDFGQWRKKLPPKIICKCPPLTLIMSLLRKTTQGLYGHGKPGKVMAF